MPDRNRSVRRPASAGKYVVLIRNLLGDRARLFGRYVSAEAAGAEVKKLRGWGFDALVLTEDEPTLNTVLLRRRA